MSELRDDNSPDFSGGDGYKAWYHPLTREWHRTNGPARIFPDGREEWYLDGKYKTQEEFERYLRMKAFW